MTTPFDTLKALVEKKAEVELVVAAAKELVEIMERIEHHVNQMIARLEMGIRSGEAKDPAWQQQFDLFAGEIQPDIHRLHEVQATLK